VTSAAAAPVDTGDAAKHALRDCRVGVVRQPPPLLVLAAAAADVKDARLGRLPPVYCVWDTRSGRACGTRMPCWRAAAAASVARVGGGRRRRQGGKVGAAAARVFVLGRVRRPRARCAAAVLAWRGSRNYCFSWRRPPLLLVLAAAAAVVMNARRGRLPHVSWVSSCPHAAHEVRSLRGGRSHWPLRDCTSDRKKKTVPNGGKKTSIAMRTRLAPLRRQSLPRTNRTCETNTATKRIQSIPVQACTGTDTKMTSGGPRKKKNRRKQTKQWAVDQ